MRGKRNKQRKIEKIGRSGQDEWRIGEMEGVGSFYVYDFLYTVYNISKWEGSHLFYSGIFIYVRREEESAATTVGTFGLLASLLSFFLISNVCLIFLGSDVTFTATYIPTDWQSGLSSSLDIARVHFVDTIIPCNGRWSWIEEIITWFFFFFLNSCFHVMWCINYVYIVFVLSSSSSSSSLFNSYSEDILLTSSNVR